ncbi:MAG: phage holin family protein [Erysipelotrichaceae bacterium]
MEQFALIMNEYIKSELLIIVPVLYVIARFMDASKVPNDKIPYVLMMVSILLAGIYTFSKIDIHSFQTILMAIFSTLVQGILLSGSAIFSGILFQSYTKNRKKNK